MIELIVIVAAGVLLAPLLLRLILETLSALPTILVLGFFALSILIVAGG